MQAIKRQLIMGGLTLACVMPAVAGLDVSAGVASQYLFRGVEQGSGHPQIFGDILAYSDSGFYANLWMSSTGSGSEEVDVIAGWGKDFGAVGVDLGMVTYYYPSGVNDNFGDLSEAYLGLSLGSVELYYFSQEAGRHVGLDDNEYYSLSYSRGAFSILVGMADLEESAGQSFENDYTHVDLNYAFNDNLSFTVSKIVDVDDEQNTNVSTSSVPGPKTYDDDTQFVVTYSLPIK